MPTRILLVILTGTILSACANPKPFQQRDDGARSEAISALAKAHGAVADWRSLLDVLDRQPYTYEVQRALKRTDGKPIVLTAYLNDILEVDADTFELRLEESSFSLNLHISLRCNAATVGFPLSDPQEHPFELAVVGRIVMVTKPLLQASAELDSDDGRPRVMVEHPSVVVATGECLATGRLRG